VHLAQDKSLNTTIMQQFEIEQHLNITAKFELVNGSTKYGVINKQIDGEKIRNDYYFISLQNVKNFQKAVSLRNYEFCKALMERINIKFIKSIQPI
jgi:hypothetical protein